MMLIVLMSVGFTFHSCSKEDDDITDNIVGTWYGTRSYYNPAGGTKFQYLTITFESNGTGDLEYESPVSYAFAKFTYSVRDSKVICQGAYADTNGAVNGDFNLTLRIEGNRLIPTDRYDMFILTRDGSIETDGSGDEVKDDSQLIYGVWVHSSGEVVIVFDSSSFTEYTLLSASSNIYSKKTEGSFSYNYRQNYVLINNARYNVLNLTENALQLKSESNNVTYNYKRGSKSDIPTNGEGSEDYRSLLELPLFWQDNSGLRSLTFHHSNQVSYMEDSSKPYGSWGTISLIANGTYWISGKEINCTFNDVNWQDGTSGAKKYFPDWECGKTNFKVFTIKSISSESLELKFENGKTYYFYPYK